MQIVSVELHEVHPLLAAVGPNGVYLLIPFKDEREVEQAARLVAPYD